MTQTELKKLLPYSVTIFGGKLLDKKSYSLLKKIVRYLVKNNWYIITGGLSVQKSVMHMPITLADKKVITLYSRDDSLTNKDYIIANRTLSYTAKNFGDQIYQMIQAQCLIVFEGGLSTLAEMTLALDFWKRYNSHSAKKPIIFFFSRLWLDYREMMIEDNLIDQESARHYFLFCHGWPRFKKQFENYFPKPLSVK